MGQIHHGSRLVGSGYKTAANFGERADASQSNI